MPGCVDAAAAAVYHQRAEPLRWPALGQGDDVADRTIGIAVFGAGRIGSLHAANVARAVPGAALVDVAAARRVVDQTGGVATARYEELLSDPAVQAVVVATPTDTHAAVMAQAAAAGKHIFCEKPIALTLEATRAAIEAVQRHGVLLQIGFNRRFDAPYVAAQQAIARGEIGEPWIVKLVGRDP